MSDKAKWFLFVVVFGFSVGILSVYLISLAQPEKTTDIAPAKQQEKIAELAPEKSEKKEKEVKKETALPERIVLNVPFYSQAPFAIWDSLHKEACEEASLNMVRDYFLKKTQDLDEQDQFLIDYVNWQTVNGYAYDITLQELADTAVAKYSFSNYRIIDNPSINDIKKEIAAGRPVIVPAAGQSLDNPYFTPPGPVYHMLVIKGYDKAGFITNDPGTRRGDSFHYEYQNLYDATHDWNPINILKGSKKVLVYSG